MKQITITLYKFNELSEVAKKKAIEHFSNINVDYNWWDSVYENFHSLAALFGITVDLKKTYFTGFYSQGDGSSYTAEIDVLKLINCLKNNSWKEDTPKEDFMQVDIDKRVLGLIEKGLIEISASVKPVNRETNIDVSYSAVYTFYRNKVDNIENELDKLETLVQSVCKRLNKILFVNLRDDYDYLTSEKAIEETIITNEYDFTEAGKFYPC